MTVDAIHHVQLAMPAGGEDAARAFYGELLGLPEVPKPPALAARGGCWFESATVRIHLGVDAAFRPAHKAHPGLSVCDLAGLTARLRTAGFAVVDDDGMPGYDRVYVTDPFGNRLELLQPI
jgi:catechol 2,3-dioxygenase-like lactoylglutathione lyase family enzyme